MNSRESSPTPPNSPVGELPLSNPNSPFSRSSLSSEESQPQLGFGYTFTINQSKIIFELGGKSELAIRHAREIMFYHLAGANVSLEKIDNSKASLKSPKDWQQFKFHINNNDVASIATMFWYLGKVTGNFRSPSELFDSYARFNSPIFVRTHDQHDDKNTRSEMLATTLSKAAEGAIIRQYEPLHTHFASTADLTNANIDRQFWTDDELAEQKPAVPPATPTINPPNIDTSWTGFFHRVPESITKIFSYNSTGSTDDECELPPQEERQDYESSSSSIFKVI
jgi:hypothetical protein